MCLLNCLNLSDIISTRKGGEKMIELNINTDELFNVVNQIHNDGFNTVKICVEESDGEMPACISFSCIDENNDCEIGYDDVFSEE